MADSSLTVSSLMLYPIKSCGGIPLSSAQVTGTGLATLNGILRDRTWVVVRDQGPKFLTQRQLPKMALIQVAVEPAALLHDAAAVDLADAALVLQAPGMPPLRVPLAPPPPSAADIIDVEVWAWTGKGVDTGAAAAEWFSAYLGRAARLVRYGGTPNLPEPASADPLRREVIWPWAPPGHEVAFADGFPVLAATDASLADLNSRLDSPVPMNRFRPNIILAGGTPWEEDTWDRVAVGEAGLELLNVKPCSRCKVSCPLLEVITAVPP